MAHAAYAYVLMLGGSIILLDASLRSSRRSRLPTATIVLGVMVSLVANLLYPTSLNPFKGMDITPLAFTISGLLFTWAIFGQRLFELVPEARETLIQVMPDGAMVLDCDGKVVEINPAARRILGLPEGGHIRQCSATVAGAGRLLREPDGRRRGNNDTPARRGAAWLEVRVSILHDAGGRPAGRLVMLRDIEQA